MKFKILILLLFILTQYPSVSQTLPANKYRNNLSVANVRYQISQYHTQLQLEFGLHYSNFQNSRFFEINDKKWMKSLPGFQARMNVLVQPLTIYGQYFSSNFDMTAYPGWRYTSDTKLNHSGFALGVHTQLLPFSKITKYFNLTAGIAYRYAEICANCTDNDNKESHIVKPASELVWTFTNQIHFSRFLYLAAEYNQSLLQSLYKNNTISVSLGYKYNNIK